LGEDELAIFDLLLKENLTKTDREKVKQASRELLAALREQLRSMSDWTKKTATEAEVQIFILDHLYHQLPQPPFTEKETEDTAARVYDFVWQRSAGGNDIASA
jgi:type I restriction enzyme R subunit